MANDRTTFPSNMNTTLSALEYRHIIAMQEAVKVMTAFLAGPKADELSKDDVTKYLETWKYTLAK